MAKKLTNEQISQIEKLGKEGKKPTEISKILIIDRGTVSKYLKKIDIVFKNNDKKIHQEIFEQLWKEGKSDLEISIFFDVSLSTIKSFRTKGDNAGKFKKIQYFSQTEQKLSLIQEQMILGSLLGDSSLSKPATNNSINSRLCLVHSIKQKELFMKKVEILDEFMGNYKLQTPPIDKRTGRIYQSFRGNSKTHGVFTELFNLLYPNNKKTITQEYLNKINHPIALAYWFMDDGTYRGTFATNSFSETEVDLLIQWLSKKWEIICTKQKNLTNFVIKISASSRKKFDEMITPYVISSLKYKLIYI